MLGTMSLDAAGARVFGFRDFGNDDVLEGDDTDGSSLATSNHCGLPKVHFPHRFVVKMVARITPTLSGL